MCEAYQQKKARPNLYEGQTVIYIFRLNSLWDVDVVVFDSSSFIGMDEVSG